MRIEKTYIMIAVVLSAILMVPLPVVTFASPTNLTLVNTNTTLKNSIPIQPSSYSSGVVGEGITQLTTVETTNDTPSPSSISGSSGGYGFDTPSQGEIPSYVIPPTIQGTYSQGTYPPKTYIGEVNQTDLNPQISSSTADKGGYGLVDPAKKIFGNSNTLGSVLASTIYDALGIVVKEVESSGVMGGVTADQTVGKITVIVLSSLAVLVTLSRKRV